MTINPAATRRSCIIVFSVLFAVGLAWALYTKHAWEDYYITYRASKNLATGQGLTFTAGERVHSFTSPLGVLLPALASVLTGNHSDVAALWTFRVMSVGALFSRCASAVLLVALFATDTKIVDFMTNGMETVFFSCFSLGPFTRSPPRRHDCTCTSVWCGRG